MEYIEMDMEVVGKTLEQELILHTETGNSERLRRLT